MSAPDKANFFSAETKDPIGKYTQPETYTGDTGNNDYPNNVQNTQTVKVRGCGAATKGCGASTKMG